MTSDPFSTFDSENIVPTGVSTSTSDNVEDRCTLRMALRSLQTALYLIRAKLRPPLLVNGDGASGKAEVSSVTIAIGGGGASSGSAANAGGVTSASPMSSPSKDASNDVLQNSSSIFYGERDKCSSASSASSGSMSALSLQALEEAVLLRLAYSNLCVSNPLCALAYARELLARPTVSPVLPNLAQNR